MIQIKKKKNLHITITSHLLDDNLVFETSSVKIQLK